MSISRIAIDAELRDIVLSQVGIVLVVATTQTGPETTTFYQLED